MYYLHTDYTTLYYSNTLYHKSSHVQQYNCSHIKNHNKESVNHLRIQYSATTKHMCQPAARDGKHSRSKYFYR